MEELRPYLDRVRAGEAVRYERLVDYPGLGPSRRVFLWQPITEFTRQGQFGMAELIAQAMQA